MERAGIIMCVRADQVKCVGPTILAPKGNDSGGLMIEQLWHQANEKCQKAGLPTMWETKDTVPVEEDYSVEADWQRVQWRITAAFQALNCVTQVPPFLQGDLPWK